jgi:hypothetical protein
VKRPAVNGSRQPERVNARAEQRLVHVNVAEAGDEPLVEQQRFDPSRAGRQTASELRGGERQDVRTQCGNVAPDETPETPDVVIKQHAVPELEHLARIGTSSAFQPERPGHAEPRDQTCRVEVEDDAFAVAPHAPERADRIERAARQLAIEHARDGFRLGQFRH